MEKNGFLAMNKTESDKETHNKIIVLDAVFFLSFNLVSEVISVVDLSDDI